ncbi:MULTISPECIES: glutamate-5-semialdehyde dehydrogenase [Treponema]|uniref:Gamma-glutamyl phosphate reductase n=1 Tax=Treponema rectale TaxID=744512 RepID=A0A840S8N8_9SPIR|nr:MULTISPECIES: glutamate-5-semialdehyde dehydrogenase [Treponema]MBB5219019.1 glutamate-5-semialdehyde dehydrogenase [Treponema rectale]MBE6355321.1 glutamate-5-semialdehyde dehydrogenase [Treponema sp.]QOS41069.1 glutamate-5-semialdehyde dehydrogenase [Treponema rectale]
MNFENTYKTLRSASEKLAQQNALQKNAALLKVAEALDEQREKILSANKTDVENARAKGTSESLIDRLTLTDSRIDGIIDSLKIVISQTDPVGEETAGWKTPNGLTIRQVRVPLGVVAIIYESRPNVTVDAFSLAYKSSNAILLRGSSSAYNSNRAIVEVIKSALNSVEGGIADAIELVETDGSSHDDVQQILTAVGKIDVVLPRGGKKLIQNVVSNAKVPVIETGSGVCHLFIDESADLQKAAVIAENAKIQRPSVCNAIECIVVHEKIAEKFLPMLKEKFNNRVKLHADEESYKILTAASSDNSCVLKAVEEDFGNEYLDYECCIKTVASLDEAITYINSHNTKHSESIITESRANAREFQSRIDASCVYVNASTRFTDGGEFGFGAELGISTQKLHARGPMGIKALTTTKYLIDGDGQIR